jgi:hypothetical protein
MTTHPDLPSPELKETLLARVRATPRPPATQYRKRSVLFLAVALSLSAAFFYWRGGFAARVATDGARARDRARCVS